MRPFSKKIAAFVFSCLLLSASAYSQTPAAPVPVKEDPIVRFEAGLRAGAAWSASKDSTIVDTADSGGNGTVGGAFHLFLVRRLAIDSGIRHRWVGIGYGSSITFQEWQVPLTIAYHFPAAADSNFFIGGGMSSLLPTSGIVYRTLGGSANVKIPASDLRGGPSYMLMIGIHGKAFGGSGYYRIESGFEYAERPLRIFTRDIFISFELGIHVFSI